MGVRFDPSTERFFEDRLIEDPGVYAMPSDATGPTIVSYDEWEDVRSDPEIKEFLEEAEAEWGGIVDEGLREHRKDKRMAIQTQRTCSCGAVMGITSDEHMDMTGYFDEFDEAHKECRDRDCTYIPRENIDLLKESTRAVVVSELLEQIRLMYSMQRPSSSWSDAVKHMWKWVDEYGRRGS